LYLDAKLALTKIVSAVRGFASKIRPELENVKPQFLTTDVALRLFSVVDLAKDPRSQGSLARSITVLPNDELQPNTSATSVTPRFYLILPR
jgi:hypothetical protein